MHRQYQKPIGHSHVCTMWPRGSPDGIWPSQSSVMMEIRHSAAFYSECADFESTRASLKKKEKKMHILTERLFPVSSSPHTSLFLSLPTHPPFLLLSMPLCLLTVPLAVTPEVQVTRPASFIGATLCYVGASD